MNIKLNKVWNLYIVNKSFAWPVRGFEVWQKNGNWLTDWLKVSLDGCSFEKMKLIPIKTINVKYWWFSPKDFLMDPGDVFSNLMKKHNL